MPKRCMVANMVSPFIGEPLSECTVSCPTDMPMRSQMSRNRPAASSVLSQSKHDQLERQLLRKDKALAEAAALLVLQKKFQALWADEA
jgi:L-lactate utilization protein LutB